MLILSHHRKKTYQRCKFKHFIRYNLRKHKPNQSIDLIFGTAFHKTLDHYYKRNRNIEYVDLLIFFKKSMEIETEDLVLSHNIDTWIQIGESILSKYYKITKEQETFKVLETELPFFLSIKDTGEILLDSPVDGEIHSDAFLIFAGKIDLVIELNNCIYFVDHKTTSLGRDKFIDAYNFDEQLLDYSIYGKWKYGNRFKGAMLNGINKRPNTTEPPIYRHFINFSDNEINYAIDTLLNIASEYYTISQIPELLTVRSQQWDCNRCEYEDVSLSKRRNENWEEVLNLFYKDLDKLDWE